MKYFLFILFSFFSFSSFASDNWWTERQITIQKNQETHAKKVYGQSARIMRENGFPTTPGASQTARDLVRRSIAVDIPTPTKVGTPMLQRIKHVIKAPGSKVLGVYAVMQLLEGIGWVMEEGTYVKKIKKDPDDPDDPSKPLYYQIRHDASHIYKGNSPEDVSQKYIVAWNSGLMNGQGPISKLKSCSITNNGLNFKCEVTLERYPDFFKTLDGQVVTNPNYDPEKEPEIKTVPITPALLGAAMLGTGYKDPDSNFNNDTVNTGKDTGVNETYQSDPSGVGNDRADDMDDKLKNAKPTGDGQSSYINDPKYDQKPLNEDADTSADRSWDNDAGEANGETKPTVDPETGQTTGGQSIAFKFPIFCEWASSMCKWYDDWKKSDQVYKDHMTKTEEHQDSEKSFWQTVKDWFDWTKEPLEDEPEQEEPEIDDQGIFNRTFDHVFSLSSECPADIPFELNTQYLSGSFSISLRWLCIIFTVLGYPLVFVSHCIGMWILYETVVRKEIKW
jgi:hypothetical protein